MAKSKLGRLYVGIGDIQNSIIFLLLLTPTVLEKIIDAPLYSIHNNLKTPHVGEFECCIGGRIR